MLVKRFNPDEELDFINEWLIVRGMHDVDSEDMPELGYMVYTDDHEPVCAGFLRMVEGNSALLDSLVTNPDVTAKLRSEAIDAVVEVLLDTADSLRLRRVIAYSVDKNTLERSKRFGFKRSEFSIIVRERGRVAPLVS